MGPSRDNFPLPEFHDEKNGRRDTVIQGFHRYHLRLVNGIHYDVHVPMACHTCMVWMLRNGYTRRFYQGLDDDSLRFSLV